MRLIKNRFEAFSDGVFAIIVTIMVLNIPLPNAFDWKHVFALIISIFVYFITFFVVGFFWHLHYEVFHDIEKISTKTGWRNILFLFSISLMPVFTKWVIENPGQAVPAVGYALVFILVNFSFQFLRRSLDSRSQDGPQDVVAIVRSGRGGIWICAAVLIILMAFFAPMASSIVLIGFPFVFSVMNLWLEREHPDERKKRFKEKAQKKNS